MNPPVRSVGLHHKVIDCERLTETLEMRLAECMQEKLHCYSITSGEILLVLTVTAA
jgi:hypothetical protein